MIPTVAKGAPFLVTNPFPAGAVLPEQCVLKQSGAPDKVSDLYTDTTGGKRCAWDLVGYSNAVHTFTMHSRKAGFSDSTGTPATCDLRAPAQPPVAQVYQALP